MVDRIETILEFEEKPHYVMLLLDLLDWILVQKPMRPGPYNPYKNINVEQL